MYSVRRTKDELLNRNFDAIKSEFGRILGILGIDEGSAADSEAGSGAGVVGAATTVEVNIGSTAKTCGSFLITDNAITGTSKVLCWQAPGPYRGKGTRADEAELAPVRVVAVEPLAGRARVKWEVPPMIVNVALATIGSPLGDGAAANSGTNRPQQVTSRRIGKVRGYVNFSYAVFT